MSKQKLIAKKYSEALAELISSDKTIVELDLIAASFKESRDLQELTRNPAVQVQVKKQILETIYSKQVSSEVMKLLNLLLRKRRLAIIPELADEYRKIYYKRSNIELAEVSSVAKLDQKELDFIKVKLEKAFNKTIEIETQVDASLLAGHKIKIAGKIIDSSLKTKLKQMKNLLGA